MKTLHRKLWRELRQLRGQALAIGAVMVAGIATMVMAQGNYHALSQTRDLYYAEYHFADVFAPLKRAPLTALDAVRALPGVGQAQARVTGVAKWDVLNVRKWPASYSQKTGELAPKVHVWVERCIIAPTGGSDWCLVERGPQRGWVNSRFLTPAYDTDI